MSGETEIVEDGGKLILKFECEYGIVSLPFDNRLEIAALHESIHQALYDYDQRKTLEEYKKH